MPLEGGRHDPVEVLLAAEVGGDHERIAAEGLEFGGGVGERTRRAVPRFDGAGRDHHLGTASGEPERGLLADTAAGTGDHCDFAVQSVVNAGHARTSWP